MLPKVILHNAVSLDGRIDGFPIDLFQYYELAASWKEDATLAGSDTFLKAASEAPSEDESAFLPPKINPSDSRGLAGHSRQPRAHTHLALSANPALLARRSGPVLRVHSPRSTCITSKRGTSTVSSRARITWICAWLWRS